MSLCDYECSQCRQVFTVSESHERFYRDLSEHSRLETLACPACGCQRLLQLVAAARPSSPPSVAGWVQRTPFC